MVLYRFTSSQPAKNVPSCAATPLCSANISDFRTRPNITEIYCTTAIRFKYAILYTSIFFIYKACRWLITAETCNVSLIH